MPTARSIDGTQSLSVGTGCCPICSQAATVWTPDLLKGDGDEGVLDESRQGVRENNASAFFLVKLRVLEAYRDQVCMSLMRQPPDDNRLAEGAPGLRRCS